MLALRRDPAVLKNTTDEGRRYLEELNHFIKEEMVPHFGPITPGCMAPGQY